MTKIGEQNLANYDRSIKEIQKILHTTLGTITIKEGLIRPHENQRIKELREKKKEITKTIRAMKREKINTEIIKENYNTTQAELRSEIEKLEAEAVLHRVEKIAEEGGAKSSKFRKVRKKILKGKLEEDYDLITEEGKCITDPETAKEYIADFYESLYQAREGKPEYQAWTNMIKATVKAIELNLKSTPQEPEFTTKEITRAIKSLKNGKSTGPDNIPNEIFKKANPQTTEVYRRLFNNIMAQKYVPGQWQNGKIIRIYKNKGTKGKCSNERGITLASNVGKLYERLINNRARHKIKITDAQAGGQKGRATVDHILLLKEAINTCKTQKKPIYITFLDVTKAYDKAWLDAIMYVMHKEGLNSNLWSIIKQLNENLSAQVQTKYGPTRKIKIKDSIRQGGVLSVLQYASLMDEINKKISKTNLGIAIPGTDTRLACLLWMDDVVLLSQTPEEMQELLNITDHVAKKYHIEFGKEKSLNLTIPPRGRNPQKINFKLGHLDIEPTGHYKYLGEIINGKNNLEDHLKSIEGKVEAAYQTLIAITEDRQFRNIKMEAVWKLLETCIIPIITYAGETMKPTKAEMQQLNRILDKIIKRILMVPTTTPREALYIESGLLDIETHIHRNRINMGLRLKGNATDTIKNICETTTPGSWGDTTKRIEELYNITEEDKTGTPGEIKGAIRRKIEESFKIKIEASGSEKSKIKYLTQGKQSWTPNRTEEYMNKLNRTEVSTIFKARTRMIDVKNNYKNKYKNLTCRACKNETETQEHILEECKAIHDKKDTTTSKEDIFSNDLQLLRTTAKKITKTMVEVETFIVQLP
jgi:hypothetical protein